MKQSCTKTALTVSAGTTRGTCAASDLPGQIVRTADGSDGIVSVAAWVRPLSSDHVTRRYRPGYTLRELLDDIAPDRAGDWTFSAHVNGVLVLPHIYHLVRPNPGTHVQFMALAFGGGGGKSPLRVIASIAIIAAASWAAAALAPALSASLGVTSQLGLRIVGGALFSALNFVGQSILNALIPPVSQNISSLAPPSGGQSYFIEAARNIIPTRGTVIPRVLGKYVMYPYYGARPYTETQGDDQYLRMLFVWGYGPLDLSNFKIGDTALEDFDGVDIEHRYGYPDDAPLTLYTDSVLQTDLTVSLTEAGGWQVRTTPSNVDEISVDISFQSGLVTYSASGSRTDATVDFEIQYAPTGTEDWSVGAAGTILTARTVALSRPVASGFSSGIRYQSNIIVMDKATGNLSVVTGHTATSSAAAADGIVPTFAVALCRVIMAGNTTSIANADITDLRTDDLPLRAAAGDFLCIQSGPDMNVLVTGGTLYYDGISVTDARSTPFIKSERFPVETGTYDVRIRRTTPDATSSQVLDTAVWTALRGFRHSDPITFSKPVAKTALRIKASGQLNGLLDQFSGVVQSILPVWNGEDWSTATTTSNNAALIKEVFQGNANKTPLPDSRVGLSDLEDFYDFCEENNFEYNGIIDVKSTVQETVNNIASAGRATSALKDGSKRTVIIDRPQDTPTQVFTPTNSWGYKGGLTFNEMPHCINVKFFNAAKGWVQDIREVYADGYDADTATDFQDVDGTGITDPDQAWKYGRYLYAVYKLRPEKHTFNVGIENIRSLRGDRITLVHDVPLGTSVTTGRVKSVGLDGSGNVETVTLETAVTMETGKTYALLVRNSVMVQAIYTVTTVAGTTATVTLATPLPPLLSPVAGDLCGFGETAYLSLDLIITGIVPNRDMTAEITAANYDENIYTADSGTIPDWTSNIADTITIPAPTQTSVKSDGTVLLRAPDGSLNNRIVITYARPVGLAQTASINGIQARYRLSGSSSSWTVVTVSDIDAGQVSLPEVEAAQTYEVQLRFLTKSSDNGPWGTLFTHTVIGKEAPPGDITGLAAQQNGEVVTLRVTPPADLDYAGTEFRYVPTE